MKPFFPEDREIKHPNQSILTIYIGPEHFSFSLYDPVESGSYFYKERTGKNRSDILSHFDETFLSLPFRKVWIMNRTPSFALVPDSFYRDNNQEDFMHFLFSNQQGITLTDSVSSAGLTILYQMPEDIYRFMLRLFSEPEFIHYSSPMITYFLKKNKNVTTRQMVVNLQENGLDIFCFSKNTLLLGNYFPCKGLSEALYYILYTWKQLQLNQLDDYLLVTGNTDFKGELVDKLKLYLQQIRFPVISPEIHFEGVETNRIPFELAALSVCGL